MGEVIALCPCRGLWAGQHTGFNRACSRAAPSDEGLRAPLTASSLGRQGSD